MKECHDSVNKILDQLSGHELYESLKFEQIKEPIYEENDMVCIHCVSKCKICNEEYSHLIASYHIEGLYL